MFARIWRYVEGPMLLLVPLCMGFMLYLGIAQAALLMLAMVVLVLAMFFAGYEASRPALRQIMPTLVLAALAAAGRILFGPIPDFKPVSAIAIIAGACLGARSGFMVGALAALTSNFFFGQGKGQHTNQISDPRHHQYVNINVMTHVHLLPLPEPDRNTLPFLPPEW